MATKIFFSADSYTTGGELWVTDGSPGNVQLVKDIWPGGWPDLFNSNFPPSFLVPDIGRLFFIATEPTGTSLWVSDGTETGTIRVADIAPGDTNRALYGEYPAPVLANGKLYFAAQDGADFKLWVTDGTPSGTNIVSGSNMPVSIVVAGSTVFATYHTYASSGGNLTATDVVSGLTTDLLIGHDARGAIAVDTKVFFIGQDPVTRIDELWVSDGSVTGTKILATGVDAQSLTSAGGKLFFRGVTSSLGRELWVSDGTVSGTNLIKDIYPGSLSSAQSFEPSSICAVGSKLFFSATSDVAGTELWVTDGSASGTYMVKDIANGPFSESYPRDFYAAGSKLYFSAWDPTNGRSLWVSDGTSDGTVLIKDLDEGSQTRDLPSNFQLVTQAVGDKLFFSAKTSAEGAELWVTDGTASGTHLVSDIFTGPGSSAPYGLKAVGGQLYFSATDPDHGYELWVTDGTASGTRLAADVSPGAASSYPGYLTVVNDPVLPGPPTAGDDYILGSDSPDTIDGLSGADTIVGFASNDCLIGSGGDDVLDGGAGLDSLYGGLGSDSLSGGVDADYLEDTNFGADTLLGGGGNDSLFAFHSLPGSTILLDGGDDDDSIGAWGTYAQAVLKGGAGQDSFDVEATGVMTSLLVDGGTGNDYLAVNMNGGAATLLGGDNNDTVRFYYSSGAVDIDGGEGNDVINMELSSTTGKVAGGTGNDALNFAQGGAGTADGGTGDDTFDINSSTIGQLLAGSGADTITLSGSSSVAGIDLGADLVVDRVVVNALTGSTTISNFTAGPAGDVLDLGTYISGLFPAWDGNVNPWGSSGFLRLVQNGSDTQIQVDRDGAAGGSFNFSTLVTLQGVTAASLDVANIPSRGYLVSSNSQGGNNILLFEAGALPIGAGTSGIDNVVFDGVGTVTLPATIENITLTGVAPSGATGNSSDNVLTGNSGDNTLYAQDGNDTVIAGQGNDSLVAGGGQGDDQYDGGLGIDVIAFRSTTLGVLVNLSTGTAIGPEIGNDTITGVENVIGGDGADTIIGDWQGNRLEGGLGSDFINGGAGADTLVGGAGNDTYVVSDPGDKIIELSGEGKDSVQSSLTITLGANIENLTLTGADSINGTGNSLDNVLVGNGAANRLTGNDGADTLDGGLGADTLIGGLGNDTFVVDDAGDAVFESAGEGIDTIFSSITKTLGSTVENLVLTGVLGINGTGNASDNVLTGNEAGNALNGAGGNDTLDGAGGNDVLIGGTGADSLSGGTGTDTASYATAATGVFASLAAPNLNTGDALGDSYLSIENLLGSGQVDTLVGDVNANRLDGGVGADSLVGGGGDDVYVVDNSGDRVLESSAAGGLDTVIASVQVTLSGNVENLTLVQGFSINGTGNGLDNLITGNDQANVLNGLVGNDTLVGGVGNDQLIGGAGADSLVGGSGTLDLASYSTSTLAGGLVANLADALQNTGDALGDRYSGVEGLIGSGFADTLTGDGGSNRLSGGAGNDVIDGGVGADTMLGGAGDDTFTVDNASDGVFENAGEGLDTVFSSVKYTLSANVENLVLTGSAGINANGNALGNVITGNDTANALNGLDGADTLNGAGGNDVLIGGVGADLLDGGPGTDTASYATALTGVTVNLAAMGLNTGDAQGDQYISIEKVLGSGQGDQLTGDANANNFNGGGGADTLDGGLGNDTLAGGTGGDLFVFASGYGKDAITDFVAADDTVQLTGLSGVFADGAAAYTASVQIGNDVVLTLDAANSLTFKNILKSALSAADFSVT
ncbi:MAG: ELWxxDGT repeat protein [Alsobacter sp.]